MDRGRRRAVIGAEPSSARSSREAMEVDSSGDISHGQMWIADVGESALGA